MSAMVEEQLNNNFSKCSIGNLISATDKVSSEEVYPLSVIELTDPYISSLKFSNNYNKNSKANNGTRTAVLNESYTIPNVKVHLPAIIEVSCEQSLNSVNSSSIHFENFDAEHSRNLEENTFLQETHTVANSFEAGDKTSNFVDSDDSLGILPDLVNDSDLSWDQLFLDDGISNFKPYHSAPLSTFMPSAIETNDCKVPFINEGVEFESPVSSCFKNGKFNSFESECSPISNMHIPVLASTPNHAFMKKLTDKLDFDGVPKNLICNISPDNVGASATRISKGEPESSTVGNPKEFNYQDENCMAVLNATYDLNFNVTIVKQEKVSIANELCSVGNDPNPNCSSLNGTYACIENLISEVKFESPPRNLETNNCATQEIACGADKTISSLGKTQVMHSTFSTESNHDKTVHLSLKQHSGESEKVEKAEYMPKIQNDGYSLDLEEFIIPDQINSSQKDKQNAMNYGLNDTISLPVDFSAKSKTILKPQNMNNRKFGVPFSHCTPRQRNTENKKENIVLNSSAINLNLKPPVNHADSFMREKSRFFKNDKSISKTKDENSRLDDLKTAISLPNKISTKSKSSIPNPRTVTKKSIGLPSSINAQKTKTEYENSLPRQFSFSSVNMQKPSTKNLNSTMLVEKAGNNSNDNICVKNCLLKGKSAAKRNSATVKKPVVSSKHLPIISQPTSNITAGSSGVLNALSFNNGKQNFSKNSIGKFKGSLNRRSLTNLPRPTTIRNDSDPKSSLKGHINYSNRLNEEKDIRSRNKDQRECKENSNPNVTTNLKRMNAIPKTQKSLREEIDILSKQKQNVSSVRTGNDEKNNLDFQKCVKIRQERRSFLPVAKRTSLAKTEIDVPVAVKSSESSQSILKRNQSALRKFQPLQYKRHP